MTTTPRVRAAHYIAEAEAQLTEALRVANGTPNLLCEADLHRLTILRDALGTAAVNVHAGRAGLLAGEHGTTGLIPPTMPNRYRDGRFKRKPREGAVLPAGPTTETVFVRLIGGGGSIYRAGHTFWHPVSLCHTTVEFAHDRVAENLALWRDVHGQDHHPEITVWRAEVVDHGDATFHLRLVEAVSTVDPNDEDVLRRGKEIMAAPKTTQRRTQG